LSCAGKTRGKVITDSYKTLSNDGLSEKPKNRSAHRMTQAIEIEGLWNCRQSTLKVAAELTKRLALGITGGANKFSV
jgi:hypothetical protein